MPKYSQIWYLELNEVNMVYECVTKSNPNFQAYEDNGDEIIGGREAEENLHPWIARIVGRCATGLSLKTPSLWMHSML